VKRLQKSMSQN